MCQRGPVSTLVTVKISCFSSYKNGKQMTQKQITMFWTKAAKSGTTKMETVIQLLIGSNSLEWVMVDINTLDCNQTIWNFIK